MQARRGLARHNREDNDMINEARELGAAGRGSRGILDESYGQLCVKKYFDRMKLGEVKNPYVRRSVAMLLENETEHLKGQLNEDTLSTSSASYVKYIYPLLRRVFPNLIANEIVSVQPMSAPVGGVFYFERVYDDEKGSKIPQYGITNNPTDMAYDGKLSAGDNMQQDFAVNYSSEHVDYDVVCTDTGTATGALSNTGANCSLPSWGPIRTPEVDAQRTYYVKAYYRIADADHATPGTAVEVCATLNAAGNLIDDTAATNNVGTFNVSTGAWSITPAGSAGSASPFWNNTVIELDYFINSELVGYTSGASLPSISLKVTLQEIKAEPRKLTTSMTAEGIQDLRAMHGVDAEADLVRTFADEVMLEIDRSIVNELIANVKFSTTATYSATVPGEIEAIRRIITQMGALSAMIHKATKRAPANFAVVGTGVANLLDQLSTHGDYASVESNIQAASYGPMQSNFGIHRIGTLLKKWAIYVNPYQDEDVILMGLRGNSYVDAGFAYAPYIPFDVTPQFYDPRDFRMHQGIMTRYATKMLREEYYGKITVSGLPTVTVL